jgi:uncharacterized protein (TIGR04255 family)
MQPKYDNAPIVEAIIAIGVSYADGSAASALAGVEQVFAKRFARSQALRMVDVVVHTEVDKEATSTLNQRPSGWKFTDETNQRVLQVLPDAFVYSHLQPYTNWETFSADAYELWREFLEVAKPSKVGRIQLRYINRLRLPLAFEFKDYLNYYPTTPEGFGPISGLVSQVQIPQPDAAKGAVALVTLASEPSADPSGSAMALDIDIFCSADLVSSDVAVWETLSQFRDAKNRLFESVLTEKLRGEIR